MNLSIANGDRKSIFVTQMENFWNKLLRLIIGITIGGIGGYCSSYHLVQLEAFWRPPVVYWLCFVLVWILNWRKDFSSVVLLLFLFLIYYVAVFGGFVFTGMMIIGGVLSFLAIYRLFGLQRFHYLSIAYFILLLIGIILDSNGSYFEQLLGGDPFYRLPDEIGVVAKVAIVLWQTITLGAISVQMYSERLMQQRIDAVFQPTTI